MLAGDVTARLHYQVDDGLEPFTYNYKREDGGPQSRGAYEPRAMTIVDGRGEQGSLSLDRNGVVLLPHATALSTQDFYERQERIMSEYYAEMRELVRRATGASRVVIFDHNVRNVQESRRRVKEQGSSAYRLIDGVQRVDGYAMGVHNDYTLESAPERIRQLSSPRGQGGSYLHREPLVPAADVDRLLSRRFAFINVWRNISEEHPIVSHPLAVCDGSSIREGHFVRSALIYRDRVGYTYGVKHRPEHRWLYFSGMRKDEALLLKVMDSKPDVVRWTAHTAFRDPRTPKGAPPRESIEVRCIAFFEDGDVERTAVTAAGIWHELGRARL